MCQSKGKGYAVLVGVNRVDEDQYGTDHWLNSPEKLVDYMEHLLKGEGYQQLKILKTEKATKKSVLGALDSYLKLLTEKDILVFYFAGHGSSVEGDPAAGAATEHRDGRLVTFDQPIEDNDLSALWESVGSAARLFAITDCCNSEGIIDHKSLRQGPGRQGAVKVVDPSRYPDPESDNDKKINMRVLHYGASERDKLAWVGDFTCSMLAALPSLPAGAGYRELFVASSLLLRPDQSAIYDPWPVNAPWLKSQPFKIEM